MRDTAQSQLMILDYVNILRLEWDVLWLTLKIDDVQFSWSEVRCVIAQFQMSSKMRIMLHE